MSQDVRRANLLGWDCSPNRLTLVDTPAGSFNGRLRVCGAFWGCGVNLIHPGVEAPDVAPDLIRGSHRADAAVVQAGELARIKYGATGVGGASAMVSFPPRSCLASPPRSC